MLRGLEHVVGRVVTKNYGQTCSQEPDDGHPVLCLGEWLVSSSQEEILNILSKEMSLTGLQFGREGIRGREARLEIRKPIRSKRSIREIDE